MPNGNRREGLLRFFNPGVYFGPGLEYRARSEFMQIPALAWQLPLAALALWLSLKVVASVYPNDLLCAEAVRTSEEAFDAALRYMRGRMPHSRSLPPDEQIRLYRSEHENCWTATRERESLISAYWFVIMEIPSTTDGRGIQHVLSVPECGRASWLGSMPAEEAPRPRNCR